MSPDWIQVRPPTGLLRVEQVRLIAGANTRLRLVGGGAFQLAAGPSAGRVLEDAGLHMHVESGVEPRVLCSPLTGRAGGRLDARPLALRLERAIAAERSPLLADPRVPGEVKLIGVDDGTGDISRLGLGVVLAAGGPAEFSVIVDGMDSGARLRSDVAEADLADWLLMIAPHSSNGSALDIAADAIPIGWLEHSHDGLVTLGTAVPGGILDARQLAFIAALERPVVLTPWRTMLLCDLDEWAAEQVVRVLAPMGFVFDAESAVLAELAETTPGANRID